MFYADKNYDPLADWEIELLYGYAPSQTPLFHQTVVERGWSDDLIIDRWS